MSKSSTRPRSAYRTYWLAAGLIALLLVAVLLIWWDWSLVATWLVVVNVLAWILLRHDKGQAQREGATRVPEAILLTLLVAGGTLGGAIGMLVPTHHKTRKPIFWIALGVGALLVVFLWARGLIV